MADTFKVNAALMASILIFGMTNAYAGSSDEPPSCKCHCMKDIKKPAKKGTYISFISLYQAPDYNSDDKWVSDKTIVDRKSCQAYRSTCNGKYLDGLSLTPTLEGKLIKCDINN